MVSKKTEEGFFITSQDGQKVFVYCWNNVSEPIGVVQIFHGMAEHAKRYTEFAEFLNNNGFIVYGDDHRGHGVTAGNVDQLGYIGKDGFNKILEDEHIISNYIQKKHKDLPIYLFAHSFGSFIGQRYIMKYGKNIKGIILSGSAIRGAAELSAAKVIAGIEKTIFSERKKSKLMDNLSFNAYNKKIRDNKHSFDWLSTDSAEVIKYEEDPLCGTLFTTGFFYYLYQSLALLSKKDLLSKIPKNLPIFIISGAEDPVGGYGKYVKNLFDMYKKTGLNKVEMKLYKGKRHELLNEVNRQETYVDVLEWLIKL